MGIKTISAFLLSFVFIQCETKTKGPATTSFKLHSLQTQPNSIIGSWMASGFMYECELTAEKDGTFRFKYSSDVGSAYSEGTWTKYLDYFILTSTVKSTMFGLPETHHLDTIRLRFNGDSLYQWDKTGKNIDLRFARVL